MSARRIIVILIAAMVVYGLLCAVESALHLWASM